MGPTLMSEPTCNCTTRTTAAELLEKLYKTYPSARNCVIVTKWLFPDLPGILVEGVVKKYAMTRARGWYSKDRSGFALFKEVVTDLATATPIDNIPEASPWKDALKDCKGINNAEFDHITERLEKSSRIAQQIMGLAPGPVTLRDTV